MSAESVGANEFPDTVGVAEQSPYNELAKQNPYLTTFRPYIPANVHLRELTALPLIVGTLLGMVFGHLRNQRPADRVIAC